MEVYNSWIEGIISLIEIRIIGSKSFINSTNHLIKTFNQVVYYFSFIDISLTYPNERIFVRDIEKGSTRLQMVV